MWIKRDSEIKKIENIWENSKHRGKTLILLGPTGVGKFNILKSFAASHNIDFEHYRCERSDLYIPLGSLKRFMSIYYPDTLRKIRSRTPPEKVYEHLLKKISEGRKIVYFGRIDYADYLSLKFITYFAVNAPKKVILAVSYPTEIEREDLSSILEQLIMEDLASIVLVDALSKDEIAQMVKDSPFENMMENVVEKSGGNPMYLTFLLNYWRKTAEIRVFNNLRDAIIENYKILSPKEKEILRIGSVSGNIFFKKVVDYIIGEDTSHNLESLMEDGWITEFSQRYGKQVHKGYVFLHEVIRDTVESLIDEERIKELHSKIGEAIEKHRVYFNWERCYELAHHYTLAKNGRKAVKYLERCAQQCMDSGDFHSAIHYLKDMEHFANSLDGYVDILNLYGKLSFALKSSSHLKESMEYDEKIISFVNLERADALRRIGDFKKALEIVETTRKRIRDDYLKMLSYKVESDILRRMGLYRDALKAVRRHLKFAEKISNEKEIGIAYKNLGNIYLSMLNYSRGEIYYRRAMEIFKKINDLEGIGAIYNNMGIVYSHTGNLEKAKEYYLKSLKIDERRRNYEGMGTAYNNLGTIYEEMGNYGEAIEAYKKSVKYNMLTGSLDGIEYAYSNLSSLYTEMGKFRDALEYANKEVSIAKKTGSVKFLISGNLSLSNIYFHIGNYKKSVEHAKKAWEIAVKYENYFDGIDAHYYLGRTYYAMGKKDLCVEHIKFALENYRKWGVEDRASHLYGLLARCEGKEIIRDMENKVKIYGPMDECEILMAKAIVYASDPRGRMFYKKAVEKLEKLKKYATLKDFMKEYAAVTGDEGIRKEVENLEKSFEYP